MEAFKRRKQHKRLETAKALRKYQKVMRQEGLEAGRGASRKARLPSASDEAVATEPASEETTTAKDGETEEGRTVAATADADADADAATHRRKRRKTNPLEKAVAKAEQAKRDAQDRAEQREEREEERRRKLRQRQRRSSLLRQRTGRGQPVMRHVANDLLHKLERQQQQQRP